MILPGDVLIQSGAPFGEAALLRAEVHTFVHNVVHETHASVESGQGVPLRLPKKEGSAVEITLGVAGDTGPGCVRLLHPCARMRASTPRPRRCGPCSNI